MCIVGLNRGWPAERAFLLRRGDVKRWDDISDYTNSRPVLLLLLFWFLFVRLL